MKYLPIHIRLLFIFDDILLKSSIKLGIISGITFEIKGNETRKRCVQGMKVVGSQECMERMVSMGIKE